MLEALGLPAAPQGHLGPARCVSGRSLGKVADGLGSNPAVEITTGKLSLARLGPPEPPGIIAVRTMIRAMLSRVDFSELLLEVTAMTGMDGEISPVAGSMPHVDDLDVSLCALIVAEAGNVGLAHASWPPYSRQPTPRRSRWRRNLSAIS